MDKVIQSIIDDLNKIPKIVRTTEQVDIKKIADEVSKVLQRQTKGRFSS